MPFIPSDANAPLTTISPVSGSPYQQTAVRVGNFTDNVNPFGLVGQGAGGYAFAPLVVDQTYGRSNPGANVTNTTQAAFFYARYYGPTSDDSAEGASSIANLVDTGTPFTQTKPVVGFEGIAIAQGGNIVTNKLVGTIGTAIAQNTSQVTNAIGLYVSALSGASAAGATITNFYGLFQETPNVTGTITNKWGAWFRDRVQVESLSSAFGTAAASGLPSSTVYVQGNSGNSVGDLVIQQGSGGNSPCISLRTSGAAVRLQLFGSSGNIQLGNGATGGSGVGLVSMVTTTIPSGTPPAAGAYLFVDPADNKLKAKTSGGTTTILTPTA